MKRKVLSGIISVVLLMLTGATVVEGGFDEWGYNWKGTIFVGTGWSQCMSMYNDETYCDSLPYKNDHLIINWNAEYERGTSEGWSNPPYDAWWSNNWNGMVPDGSGQIWQYVFKWDEGCATTGIPSIEPEIGTTYCLGQFVMTMSHGTYEGQHVWGVRATPPRT